MEHRTTEPFARERVIALGFERTCAERDVILKNGMRDALAQVLADYRQEMRVLWEEERERAAKSGF